MRATGTSVVAIGPGAAYQPHAAAVAAVLTDYFADINHSDFRAYRNLLTTGLRRIETPERIRSGYQSTADSGVTVVRLTASGGGRLLAAVTFLSHQAPADSPDRSWCDDWRVTLDLVPHQGGYLIGGPPPGHQASYRPCG